MGNEKSPSLVCNDHMAIEFVWELSGIEVDCISRLISGLKTKKITEDDITDFLSAAFDSFLVQGADCDLSTKAQSPEAKQDKFTLNFEKAVASWREDGCSEQQIVRMVRGWDSAGRVMGLDGVERGVNEND